MGEQRPLPPGEAWRAVAACFASTFPLLTRHHVHLAGDRLGTRLRFTDGTSARVYRETRLGSGLAKDPCTLVVTFRLRLVHGRAHGLFRLESLLNTPLFVGFPGFTSKLWLAHDEQGRYRGVYEWDGAQRAECYARSLWFWRWSACPVRSGTRSCPACVGTTSSPIPGWSERSRPTPQPTRPGGAYGPGCDVSRGHPRRRRRHDRAHPGATGT